MAEPDLVAFSSIQLRPDPSRTVIRPFNVEYPGPFKVEGHPRAERVIDRVLSLTHDELHAERKRVTESLDERHRDVDDLLLHRFGEVMAVVHDTRAITRDQQVLIGAYLSEEYSFEAAALFNPSMVLHPDQTGAPDDGLRFILSLRGIGEGHVSSVTFRTGSWSPQDGFSVDPASRTAVPPRIEPSDQGATDGGPTRLQCGNSRAVSETVLFPILPSQRQGIEDLRLVRFEDAGEVQYLGTYTAFSGSETRCELLRGEDFKTFEMQPMRGAVAGTKGMALFPRKIDSRYAMLGRQDNENIWYLTSDDLLTWEGGTRIVEPKWPWEFIQMGNCGSPIEIDEGWLVLTHGVGSVRNYCVGACLLDKADPTKLLKRMTEPLIVPSPKERDGYVPNVVYSCGGIVHGRTLLLPFGVADNFASFATVDVGRLIAAMA
ncbi:glycosidase [Sphingomonas sp. UV9]|uniref:glycoside hydrolase family 130 protein n=1 Tax=Sphingomonas sp. UV9 TaxID=1851410 RepID=UPI000FFBD005|nr:glycoside hydrolase family 130 protein [Sphingomonas sp. UV9]RXD05346.1 glycosidase [Sphingomonas sp. UV9]